MASEGQEEHALRAPEHDHDEIRSIAEMRQFILSQVDLAYDAFQRSRSEGGRITKQDIRPQSITVDFWLEHYGIIKVPVWEPLFIMGKAVHALQDSFAHTYRSDTLQIYAVGILLRLLIQNTMKLQMVQGIAIISRAVRIKMFFLFETQLYWRQENYF